MHNKNHQIITEIEKNLHGKKEIIELVYASFLASGHVLLEDVPGVGKTTLAYSIAKTTNLPFKRLQCTNDMLPSDMIGASIWNPETKEFVFQPGPIFTNILIADEINRAPSKSQSALLEAMEEQQISIEGRHYKLDNPFWVVATQNPSEHSGTNELPESQLDRFLIKVSMGYPDEISEKQMLKRSFENRRGIELKALNIDVLQERESSQKVIVKDDIINYIYNLVNATRDKNNFKLGLSPRAALGLLAITKAWAWLQGRDYVIPYDVQYVFPYVAGHRVIANSKTSGQAVREILEKISVPA